MTNEKTIGEIAKETHGALTEFLSHARAGGRELEGDVAGFIKKTAHHIEKLIEAIGRDAVAAEHKLHLDALKELGRRMLEQVEENEVLQSFWEEMVEEIPDLIEWIQSFLEKGGDALIETAQTAAEAAPEIAEAASEVASAV